MSSIAILSFNCFSFDNNAYAYVSAWVSARLFIRTRIVVLLIKKFWSRAVMKTIGIEWELVGLKSEAHVFVSTTFPGLMAVNSILDVVFISKKEVRSWPGFQESLLL